jgi:hypothetical protein
MGEPTAIYMSLMEQIDLRRRKLKWPAWQLDDRAGLQDGYSQKALHADAPSGRQASWQMIGYMVGALYPRGVRVKLIACRKKRMPDPPSNNGKNGRRTERSKIVLPQNVRLFLAEQARERGKKGAAARNSSLSARQRSRLARRAAEIRWADVRQAVKQPRKRGRPPNGR